MRLPIILVDGQDINFFDSVAAVERYVESPDIERYRVFDAEGQVLRLTSNTGAPTQRRWLGCVPVSKVEVLQLEPPEIASAELLQVLSNHLIQLTGKPREGLGLGDLVRELMEHIPVES
jgi:hypothetical protein